MANENVTEKTRQELLEEQEKLDEKSEKTVDKLKKSEKSVKHYQWFVLRLLLLIIVIWVLFWKVVGITRMPNADMYPRVDAGDMVLFYRLEKNIKAQDIVVMEKATPDSGGETQLFICRVVAAPGDTVEITGNDRLVVNGNTMVESNIFYPTPIYEGFLEYPVTLGSDEYFVLADSRNGGADSRYFGPVKKGEIEGTVITILRRNNL